MYESRSLATVPRPVNGPTSNPLVHCIPLDYIDIDTTSKNTTLSCSDDSVSVVDACLFGAEIGVDGIEEEVNDEVDEELE